MLIVYNFVSLDMCASVLRQVLAEQYSIDLWAFETSLLDSRLNLCVSVDYMLSVYILCCTSVHGKVETITTTGV